MESAHDTTTIVNRLLSAASEEEVCQAGAELLSETFESPASIYSVDDDRLVARATTETYVDEVYRSIPLSDRILARTAQLERPALIDDCTETRSASAARPEADAADSTAGTYRSALLVPVPDWGLLVVGDEEPGVFDERDLATACLVAHLLAERLTAVSGPAGTSVAEQRLEKVASILSHDLSSPITVSRAYLQDAIERGETENLEKVLLAIDRIDEITNGLAMFARTGNAVDAPEPVELRGAAESAWSMVDSADARLEIVTSETVLADEHRLYQLLENLLANAVQHGGDSVTVRVGPLEDGSGFFVEDDGPGIPAEQRELVFEHGYSDTEAHSGFGLSIVRGIVEAHGWEIAVVDGEDGGARFEIAGVTVSGK